MPARDPSVVAVGGGHGLAASLRAIRRYTSDVTAVVSVADDGGSTGRLRETSHGLAPGDLRKCLVALAAPDNPLAAALEYRFVGGEMGGHALGNLLIAALSETMGDIVASLDEVSRLLDGTGRVLPAAIESVVLVGRTVEGDEVHGQVAVMKSHGVESVWLEPAAPDAPTAAIESIAAADQVVLGPGSLFTSVLAATAVPAVREAIAATAARTVYVCNLRPQVPETESFTVADHLSALARHGIEVDDVVIDEAGLESGEVDPAVALHVGELSDPRGLVHDPELLADVLRSLT